jgi:thiol:disulfide interchange protein
MIKELLSFYFGGILLEFTPCVLPMIPLLFSVIVGKEKLGYQSFFISLTYVLTMSLAYAGFGVISALAGSSLAAYLQTPQVLGCFSLLFLILALIQLELIPIHLSSSKLTTWAQSIKGGSYISAALMGVVATIACSPCISAPLIGALNYISLTGDIYKGGLYLFVLGLGMGTIILIVGICGPTLLNKVKPYMKIISRVFGIILLGLSIHYGLKTYQTIKYYEPIQLEQFINITNDQELQTYNKQSILFICAKWCDSCKDIEKNIFTDKKVLKRLKDYNLLVLDVTDFKKYKPWLKELKIIGPPTIIFYDKDGKEIPDTRIVGEISKKDFMEAVEQNG